MTSEIQIQPPKKNTRVPAKAEGRGWRLTTKRRSGGGQRFEMFAEDGLAGGDAGKEFVGERFGERIPEV